jgi:hypothetical protein
MHSGWGVVVAISVNAGSLEVVDRRRITLAATGTPGGKQPYHFAKNLDLHQAEKFLGSCFEASARLASAAIWELIGELRRRRYRVAGSAVLLASGRPLPPLAKILSSHALIHAAEGSFFRSAIWRACDDLELAVTGVRECNLDECVRKAFGKEAARIYRQILAFGRSLGPPWTKDQKTAALAALLLLSNKRHPAPMVDAGSLHLG